MCQRDFFNKVAGLRPATLVKKSLWQRSSPVIFVKFLRTPSLAEYLWWLLLTLIRCTVLQTDVVWMRVVTVSMRSFF